MESDMHPTLLLLQLSDSVFPIGGFSHSIGLEAFVQHGKSRRMERAQLVQAFVCVLENTGSFAVPFVKASHECQGQAERLLQLDRRLEASCSNHIAKRASARQGKSLVDTALHIYANLKPDSVATLEALPYKHFPVVFGALTFALGLECRQVVAAFMFCIARTVVATAVRLDVVGAVENSTAISGLLPLSPTISVAMGQKIQVHLQQLVPDIIQRNDDRDVDSTAIKFPLVDVLQNTHDTLFCKLFYS